MNTDINRSTTRKRSPIAAALGVLATAALLLPVLLGGASRPADNRAEAGGSSGFGASAAGPDIGVPDGLNASDSARSAIDSTPAKQLQATALESGAFVELTLEDGEAAAAMRATVPVSEMLRDRRPGEVVPTQAGILKAIDLLEGMLSSRGFDGRITVFPQAFMSFRGLAPAFSELLGTDKYRIDIDVHPNPEGSLQLNAKLELALYEANFEDDLPVDAPRGSVWLSDKVAYGHNAGADPDEWAAFDLGEELIFVRVFHSGDTSQLLGLDLFIKTAADTARAMQALGLTRFPSVESDAFRDDPEVADMLSTVFVTNCDGAVCRRLQSPPAD